MEAGRRPNRGPSSSLPDASSPKRRRISQASPQRSTASSRVTSPKQSENVTELTPAPVSPSPQNTRAPPFSRVQNEQLSNGTYLLQVLQHVLRQRLREALRGHLHKIALPGPPSTAAPNKRQAFEPSPAVESLLRGESAAAAALRIRSSSSNKGALSLEGAAAALAAKLMCCLQLKEKSSILVLGPRGSGTTTAVESALRLVQQQQQQQEGGLKQQLLVVWVNCSLYPSDAAILQAIVRRLCAALHREHQQNPQQQQLSGGTFEDWMKRLKDILIDSCSVFGRAVVVVLDRVEICCLPSSERGTGGGAYQHLLYNLFDLQHGEGLHICSICLSPVLDLTDMMEKRIRSRFTMQKLCLSSAVKSDQLTDFMQNKLLRVSPQHLLAAARHLSSEPLSSPDERTVEEFVKAFDGAVNNALTSSHFSLLSERALSLGRSARSFLVDAVSPLLLLHPPLPRVVAERPDGLWGAPEAPEALSPLRSPVKTREAVSGLPNNNNEETIAVEECTQQQQLQRQESEGLSLCSDVINSSRAFEEELLLFASLSFSEHLVLTAMARLHRKRVLPKTFLAVLQETSNFFKLHDKMRRKISQPGLRRAFGRLHEAGLLQRCAYGLQHLGLSGVSSDFLGSHLPYKFPGHERYADAITTLPVPSDLALWLRSHSFNS